MYMYIFKYVWVPIYVNLYKYIHIHELVFFLSVSTDCDMPVSD